MIVKGEVYKDNGMYVLWEGGEGEVLKERIKELEESLSKAKEELKAERGKNATQEKDREGEGGKNTTLSGTNLEKLKELESDLEFQMGENEKLEAKVERYQEYIRNCYRWVQGVKKDKTPRPIFKKEVLKMEDEIAWEDNQ